MAEINEEANMSSFQFGHRNNQHGQQIVEEDSEGEFFYYNVV
jgi:hypothetical protein